MDRAGICCVRIMGKEKVILITTKEQLRKELEQFHKYYENDLEILGIACDEKCDEIPGYNIQFTCCYEEVTDRIRTEWIDAVLISGCTGHKLPADVIRTCSTMGITVYCSMEKLTVVSGIRIVSQRQRVVKRMMDICGGLVGVALTLILTVFLAPAIWLSSPGPVFFSQIRIGQNGKRFRMYKFRSMHLDAEEKKSELMGSNEMQGLMFKLKEDPRIIGSGPDGKRKGLGWLIRSTSIDEFPQFFNVLKGDMSLVGTRPPTEDEWVRYSPAQRARLAVKPGLTGIWQVSGRSTVTDFDEVVRMDMEYVRHWNTGLDLRILCKTVPAVMSGTGAR